jgi:ganglioside-induced differentiation-associated protein 1
MGSAAGTMKADGTLKLYHAPSSYYSMIARMALAENAIRYRPVFVDIHARMSQQEPDYVRLNPDMTVPTLVGPDFVLAQSRDIAEFAFGLRESGVDAETRAWLDLHYGFPIEELTFGRLLTRNPLTRVMIPKRLQAARRRLVALAAANPDLAGLYDKRAEVFAARVIAFDPHLLGVLAERRQAEAISFLDRLEAVLADGRSSLVPPRFGVADVAWTVFLARMEFAGLREEVAKRPALARYWRAASARPAYAAADIWTRLHFGRLVAGILGFSR